MTTRIALCIGIDNYAQNPLKGCVADATNLADALKRHSDGEINFQCKLLVAGSARVTQATLRESVSDLFSRSGVEIALFYFAGHGFLDATLGGYLVSQDHEKGNRGVPLQEIVALANASRATERIIILDCCHSGSISDLAVTQSPMPIAAGVTMFAACKKDEGAAEKSGRGVFTELFSDALRGGAADIRGHVTSASIYAYIDEVLNAWDQRPLFHANVSQLSVVMRTQPSISDEVLRKLTEYFPSASHKLQLAPDYEHTSAAVDDQKSKIFRDLQRFRAARLVVPIDTEHMYDAAMQSKSCALTPLGQFYWRRVKNGKI